MPYSERQATKNAPINRSASSRCRGRIRSAACGQSNRAASRPNRPRVPSAGINRFRCNGYVLSRTRQHPDSRGADYSGIPSPLLWRGAPGCIVHAVCVWPLCISTVNEEFHDMFFCGMVERGGVVRSHLKCRTFQFSGSLKPLYKGYLKTTPIPPSRKTPDMLLLFSANSADTHVRWKAGG